MGRNSHQYTNSGGAPDRFKLGLGIRAEHSACAPRAGDLERISAAARGPRRLAGAVVRRLPGSKPLDGVRPLPPFRRTFGLLDQSRDPGAGDAVDPATDAAHLRP